MMESHKVKSGPGGDRIGRDQACRGIGSSLCKERSDGLLRSITLSLGVLVATVHVLGAAPLMPASTSTDPTRAPMYFKIPAPRGQILDAQGGALARTKLVMRLMLRVPPLPEETVHSYARWFDERWDELSKSYPGIAKPSLESLESHFKHRRMLPFPMSGTFPEAYAQEHAKDPQGIGRWRAEYQREYPHGASAAHVVGYVSPEGPIANGPLHDFESLWRETVGRDGLESSLNKQLAGKPGLMLVTCDLKTQELEERVLIPPTPGEDVVTTLNMATQGSAEKLLAESKRPGAVVVMNALTGAVIAMASYPTFDPMSFAAGMSQEEFDRFAKQKGDPLVDRAAVSQYPPGSVFKPFMALGFLRAGTVMPNTILLCGPKLDIDGRTFRNWSKTDEGWFDLRAALVRSCNTYFYQVAIGTGDRAMLDTAREFGFGETFDFALKDRATGTIPKKAANRRALANLSIGQGEVLASPLQVTAAMAGLAHGRQRPNATVVSQLQNQQQEVVWSAGTGPVHALNFSEEHLQLVREGMYAVVNHEQGTATKARLKETRVFGKTGTAQWSNKGTMANVVWFGGFVADSSPPIAFAAVLEGEEGDDISGGMTAAPVMGRVLADIFGDPAKHGIQNQNAPAPYLKDPLLKAPQALPVLANDPGIPTAPAPVDPYGVAPPPAAMPVLANQPPVAALQTQVAPNTVRVQPAAATPAVTLSTAPPGPQQQPAMPRQVPPGTTLVLEEPPVAMSNAPQLGQPEQTPVVSEAPPAVAVNEAPPQPKRGFSLFKKKPAPPKAVAVEESIPPAPVANPASGPTPVAMSTETPVAVSVASPDSTANNTQRSPKSAPPKAEAVEPAPATPTIAEPPVKSKGKRTKPAALVPEKIPVAPTPVVADQSPGKAAIPKAVAADTPSAAQPVVAQPVEEAPPPPKPKKFRLFGKDEDDN